MTDAKAQQDSTLVERWLQEQHEWQRTVLTYIDSMVKSDEFLVNLGNAMRGSLLAGKAYPGAAPPGGTPAPSSDADDRLDKILFALNTLQGQLHDLSLSVEEIRRTVTAPPPKLKAATRGKAAGSTAIARRKERA